MPAPRDVYTAVIYNAQNKSIQCSVIWSQPYGLQQESAIFTVEKHNCELTKKKTIGMGTWEARGVIKEIQCDNLVLKAPFYGVTSPQTNWGFRVEPNEIVSMGSGSCKNTN
ncbi:unnamed protein product [Rotaria socialis]|nr:unnamed protein product [Rotaria socialis]CAF3497071.1 unnamed protein product [Rotaria socialis]CAF4243929.1 unnamed protein product [Rotaria socialis]CAF4354987.1 unnamed protein product [Rotaria socialis]CAF4450334.1 unnamed protein product [Rotaria socialis]